MANYTETFTSVTGNVVDASELEGEFDAIATAIATKLDSDGSGALTGALSMGSNKITNVTDPTNPQDAATMAYTDRFWNETGYHGNSPGTQNVSTGAFSDMNFSSSPVDPGGNYSVDTYTVPTGHTGYYLISCTIATSDSVAAAESYSIAVSVAGARISISAKGVADTGSNIIHTMTAVVAATAADAIILQATTGGTAITTAGGSHLTIVRIA